jgi:hypothetical protein
MLDLLQMQAMGVCRLVCAKGWRGASFAAGLQGAAVLVDATRSKDARSCEWDQRSEYGFFFIFAANSTILLIASAREGRST